MCSTTTPGCAWPRSPDACSPAGRCGRCSSTPCFRWGLPAEVLTDNGAVFTGKQRGQGRVALEVAVRPARDPGLAIPGRIIRRPAGRWNGSTRPEKKWLTAQPRAATLVGLQHQLNRFRRYYNTIRPHRALGRRTPAEAYAARPKAAP